MYGIFAYIYHKNQPNVGKYTIHGSSGVVSGQTLYRLHLPNSPLLFTSLVVTSLILTKTTGQMDKQPAQLAMLEKTARVMDSNGVFRKHFCQGS